MIRRARSIVPLLIALALFGVAVGFNPSRWIDLIPDVVVPVPDVANEYGVGAIAYTAAPRDGQSKNVASIYRQSADFLFGKPSLKFITSSNSKDANNPDRSVIAWQNKQFESINGWDDWRSKISKAFSESQSKKQYSRTDWRDAFIEIALALEAVK